MEVKKVGLTRRNVLSAMASGAALGLSGIVSAKPQKPNLPSPSESAGASALAKDESFWREVAGYYDRTEGIVNLEHGYWGKMAHPVQDAFVAATKMINAQNSFYARKGYGEDASFSGHRIAKALGADDEEIVITRNATEAIHNLIRQYVGLNPNDSVLYADLDYPSFKETMVWLEKAYGVNSVAVEIPQRATQAQILAMYVAAFDANPNLKLMLITHVSNQHGLVVPVADIAAEAKARGIDVICDSAQSWGLLDYKISDLKVDWAGFNLHKWIGSPVGVGALYMKKGSLEKISPYPGESDLENSQASKRVHMATSNFASIITIPHAIDFHESIGGANKEARLRYLRQLWTTEAETMSHIELLGGLDEESWTGMASFRLPGKNTVADSQELQQRLEKEFGIFTVIRVGLASGSCVRITPQVFTSADEIGVLVDAMKKLA
ncbi:MAG: aminotransferase class V-fold PLP-dependent enzyme [Pseudohongiellaceae bacterium]